jgi:putative ABC transport system substrate-binding protein
MKRREFITLLGGASLAWPLAAQAQQPRRIGVLTLFSERDTEGRSRFSAFQEGLREAGWVEGRNIRTDYRWADGDPDRLRAYAAEIVGSAPEAIFCNSTPVLAALRKETQTIPIVFTGVSDPVGAGFVASLARPGGNLTGFANFGFRDGREVAARTKRGGPERKPRCIHSGPTECQLGEPLSRRHRGRRPDVRRDRERR